MKLSDIKVGALLLWNSDNRWVEGHGTDYRVKVISAQLGHWYIDKGGQFRDHGAKVQNPYGIWTTRGVIVEREIWIGNQQTTVREVAPLGQLRGTWDDCQVALANVVEAKEKKRKEAEARRIALQAERDRDIAVSGAVIARLIDRGAVRYADVIAGGRTIEVTPELLDAMLDAIPENWRYEK